MGALSLLVPVDPTPIGSGLSSASVTATATAPGRPPVTASASTAAPSAEAETEADYLARATGQIQKEPAEALALAEGHAARFPEGKLGQERELIAISALAALGRKAEARARANLFLTLFPESAHKPRLEELLSGLAEKRPPP